MVMIIGIVVAIAIAATAVALNQTASPNIAANNLQASDQPENSTGKKITIGLNENLGLKEKP
jgi:hypothetical protein